MFYSKKRISKKSFISNSNNNYRSHSYNSYINSLQTEY